MKVKIKKPVTFRNGVSGELTSYRDGAIVTVSDETGAAWIADGLAEEYTLVTPTGTKTITANGEGIDVSGYAEADVNVPSVQPTGAISITANGNGIDVAQYATANVNVPSYGSCYFECTNDSGFDDGANFAMLRVVNGFVSDPGDPQDLGETGMDFIGWAPYDAEEPSQSTISFPYPTNGNQKFVSVWQAVEE